jgi:hypothetical protein
MQIEITCPSCEHIAVVDFPELDDDAPAEQVAAAKNGLFTCDECRARFANGRFAPRVVVEPFHDDQGVGFVRVRFQHPKTKEDLFVADFDPQNAASQAKQILSLVIP